MIKKYTLLVFTFCLVLLSACSYNDIKIPQTFEHQNVTYKNCHLKQTDLESINKPLKSLKGKALLKMGSRSYPWMGLAVNNYVLFDATTKQLLEDITALENQNLYLIGYKGQGEIVFSRKIRSFRNGISEEKKTIKIEKAFFVTEIKGWVKACGNPVDTETGIAFKDEKCFWVNIKEYIKKQNDSN